MNWFSEASHFKRHDHEALAWRYSVICQALPKADCPRHCPTRSPRHVENNLISAVRSLHTSLTSYSRVHKKRNNLKLTTLGWEPVSIIYYTRTGSSFTFKFDLSLMFLNVSGYSWIGQHDRMVSDKLMFHSFNKKSVRFIYIFH